MGRLIGTPRVDEAAEGAPHIKALFIPLAVQNFLMAYTSTAMNVALADIIRDLGTTLTAVQSVISLYALVIAAFVIAGSKLGARRGHWRVFIAGAEIFALGSLVTALAPGIGALMIGWSLLLGIGVALMLPALLSLLTATLSGTSRTKALALIGTIGGLGAAAGPLLGGVITHYLSWRASFLMSAVLSVVVVLLLRRAGDPEPRHERPRQPFDLPGAALSALGCGLLVVATLLAGRYGLLTARHDFEAFGRTLLPQGGLSPVALFGLIGVMLLGAFAAWELRLVKRAGDPLVRVSVLSNRTVRFASATQALQYLVPAGALFLLPVFVQTTLGFNALRCGLVLLPTTLGLVTAAPVVTKLVTNGRMTQRAAQAWSFLLMISGCVLIVAMFRPYEQGVFSTGLGFAPGLFLFGLGQGMSTTLTDLVQSAPPPHEVSDVAGLSRSGNYLGSAMGIALAGALMTVTLLYSFEAGVDQSTVLTGGEKKIVKETLERQVQLTAAGDETLRERLRARGVRDAAADELVRINARARDRALTSGIIGMVVLAVGGCLVALRIPRTPVEAK
ncbi:MFS transporter [Actinocorallia sp. B10E7]|uniref:MFS transporter n=1 Tax=Actinocorallia sp. B10E7 TaxID=3153558 RepID=UPI00325CB1D0